MIVHIISVYFAQYLVVQNTSPGLHCSILMMACVSSINNWLCDFSWQESDSMENYVAKSKSVSA